MNISVLKISIFGLLGVVGSYISQLFGGWSMDLQTLLLFMVVDYVSGLILAGVFKKSEKTKSGALSSNVGFKGLCKKIGILFCVLIAYRLDISIGTDYIRTAVIIAFIVNEAVSIGENVGLRGVPIPPAILKAIDVLKNKKEND